MKKSGAGDRIIVFLHYLLAALAVLYIIKDPSNLYPPMVLSVFFVVVFLARFFFKLENTHIFLIIILFYLEIAGESFGLYLFQYFYYYDKFLHFSSGVILTIIIYDYLKSHGLKVKIGLFSLLSLLGLGALWEILEYTLDATVNSDVKMQGVFSITKIMIFDPLGDTIWDLIAALIGSSTILILGYLYKKLKDQ